MDAIKQNPDFSAQLEPNWQSTALRKEHST